MPARNSQVSGFYKLSLDERLRLLGEFASLEPAEIQELRQAGSLRIDLAERLIENVVSTVELPVGVAVNFMINGQDYMIPMAIEEPSVVAACSNAAKIARAAGGFQSESSSPVMVGQIQITEYDDFKRL